MKRGRGREENLLSVILVLICGLKSVKKNYQFFRSTLSLCLHFAMISFLLFRVKVGSAMDMWVFSMMQRWHVLTFLL